MTSLRLSLLRGICQTPAYVADALGFFEEEGITPELTIEPTASVVPAKLAAGEADFAVIPWTRVAVTAGHDDPLVVVCGSGHEEAALVVRAGLEVGEIRTVAVPLRGGIKDLTAAALIESLGLEGVDVIRQPSGDGAIISLFGRGCDAASMVEPYATMLEELGIGTVVRRTGDVWPGAPGCSLATTAAARDARPELVESVVRAFVRGVGFTRSEPEETAEIAARHIGIDSSFIAAALRRHPPAADAIRSDDSIGAILSLMRRLGYLAGPTTGLFDLSFLDRAAAPAR